MRDWGSRPLRWHRAIPRTSTPLGLIDLVLVQISHPAPAATPTADCPMPIADCPSPLASCFFMAPTSHKKYLFIVLCLLFFFSSDQPIRTPFGCLVIITPYPVVMYCPLVAYIYINACLPRKTQHQKTLNRSKEHSRACGFSLVVITFPHEVGNL